MQGKLMMIQRFGRINDKAVPNKADNEVVEFDTEKGNKDTTMTTIPPLVKERSET